MTDRHDDPGLGRTLGATLINGIVTQLLYGVALSQAAYYFWVYRKDPWRFKLLVVVWLLLDSVKTATALEAVFDEIVFTHADVRALGKAPIADGIENTVGWVLVFTVHCFYIHNMNQVLLSSHMKYRILAIVGAVFCATVTLVAGSVAISLVMYRKKLAHVALGALTPPCMVLITDIYISFFLWWGLRGSRPYFSTRTERMLDRLISYTAERGLLLCLVQLICLSVYTYELASGTHGVTASVFFIEGPVYFNSGMVVLNVRRHVRDTLATRRRAEAIPLERRGQPADKNYIYASELSGKPHSASATV